MTLTVLAEPPEANLPSRSAIRLSGDRCGEPRHGPSARPSRSCAVTAPRTMSCPSPSWCGAPACTKRRWHRLAGELVANRLLDRVEGGLPAQRWAVRTRDARIARTQSARDGDAVPAGPLRAQPRDRAPRSPRRARRLYVAKIGGHRQAISPSRTGGRIPLHCSAIGKALLAHCEPDLRREVLSAPLVRRTPHTIVAPGSCRPSSTRWSRPVSRSNARSRRGNRVRGRAGVRGRRPHRRGHQRHRTHQPVPARSQVAAVRAAAEGLRSTMSRRRACADHTPSAFATRIRQISIGTASTLRPDSSRTRPIRLKKRSVTVRSRISSDGTVRRRSCSSRWTSSSDRTHTE